MHKYTCAKKLWAQANKKNSTIEQGIDSSWEQRLKIHGAASCSTVPACGIRSCSIDESLDDDFKFQTIGRSTGGKYRQCQNQKINSWHKLSMENQLYTILKTMNLNSCAEGAGGGPVLARPTASTAQRQNCTEFSCRGQRLVAAASVINCVHTYVSKNTQNRHSNVWNNTHALSILENVKLKVCAPWS